MGEHWQMNHLSPLLVILPGSRKKDFCFGVQSLVQRGSSHLCLLLTRSDKNFIWMVNQGINMNCECDCDPAQWIAWSWLWVTSLKWIELSSASERSVPVHHLLTESTGRHQLKGRPKTGWDPGDRGQKYFSSRALQWMSTSPTTSTTQNSKEKGFF